MSTLGETGEIENEFATEVAPDTGTKRRGRQPYPRDPVTGEMIRPDGSKGKPQGRPRSKISLEAQLDGFVTLVNTFVLAFKPAMGLDQIEKAALVKALDQQCQTSPKFRKYIEKFLQGAGGVNLLGVVLLIVSRRVLRANLVPIPEDAPIKSEQLDNMAGALLFAMTTGTPSAVPTGV